MSPSCRLSGLALVCAFVFSPGAHAAASPSSAVFRLPDHYEFAATLDARFTPDATGRIPVRLDFDYPAAGDATTASWRLQVLAPDGSVVRSWIGDALLRDGRGSHRLVWDGRAADGRALAPGFYTLRLRSVPGLRQESERQSTLGERVALSFRMAADEQVEQRYDVRIGNVPAPTMPAFAGLAHGAGKRIKGTASVQAVPAATLPYVIYYGNLHSQTNHSDGGGDLSTCASAQGPQSGAFGPADAFAMMDVQAGGDFLLASEHNHMYDGSTGTRTTADPAAANALYTSGLLDAANYSAAHPDFLALYGMEWGVISNGGHLNIVNPQALANWELNASGQLIGTVNTPKSDYAALYATMKQQGWVGQFNHPATTGQFQINAVPLAFDANGADVMVLAEVMNSSAFSTNTSETETSRSTFTGAWNTLLERGYHVGPATNQDNHCANWGLSLRNRTGVLLPTGVALNNASFVEALRARRVFASEDKTAQLVLTGDGFVMGQSIANSDTLTLVANYASSNGQSAARVQFFEGVPGRNGTVTQLFEGAGSYTFTPANGEHFYYALVTEGDGDRLWSAPLWVSQGTGTPDTTAPTVSATESGSSGTITLSASASDNVGVSNVEFYVDGVLKGSDASSPYAISLDSNTLSNADHSLTAKAFDAAGNVGTSAPVTFTIANPLADTVAPSVTAAESGSSGTITLSASASDNVGVSNVEFYVDGVLKGADATSPYAISLDSTTLSNASHSLTAKAFDAAGNVGTSAPVSFTIANPVATVFTETESNGSIANANVVARSFTKIVGTMGNTTDKDHFQLSLNANETLRIDMVGPSGKNYDLYLFDASGKQLKKSTTSTSTETLTYVNGSSAKLVYARVTTRSGSSTTLTYTLTLTYTP